jgi:hypothetical protein
MVVGSIASSAGTVTGVAAGSIAVVGFLFHAAPALSGGTEEELRRATVVGGLIGFLIAVGVMVLSAIID